MSTGWARPCAPYAAAAPLELPETSMMSKDYSRMADELAGERVMLLGGAGFIGHHLALELARLGTPVAVVDNLSVNNLVSNALDGKIDALRRVLYRGFLDDRYRLMQESGVRFDNV